MGLRPQNLPLGVIIVVELNKFSKGDDEEKKRWERKELESLPKFQAHPKDNTPLFYLELWYMDCSYWQNICCLWCVWCQDLSSLTLLAVACIRHVVFLE